MIFKKNYQHGKELSYRENKMCSETSEAVGTTWEHAQLEFRKFLKIRITLMEYQRAEESDKKKKRKKRKSKVATVKSTWLVDENENPRTRWEKFAAILSRCKVPGLKTLGRKILI